MSPDGPVPASYPPVLCCVLDWNGLADTEECVASLQALGYPNRDVLVIDNGSLQDEAALLRQRFPGAVLTLRLEANEGFGGGMNRGIAYALDHGYAFVLLLNNDCTVAQDLLTRMMPEMARPGVAMAGPAVCYHDRPSTVNSAGSRFERGGLTERRLGRNEGVDRLPSDPYEVDFVDGSCMLVSLARVREVGSVDPVYFAYWEEVEWASRFRRKGYRILCVPAARTWHKIGRSTGGSGTEFYVYAYLRNELRFARSHPEALRTSFLALRYAWDLVRMAPRLLWHRREAAPSAPGRYLRLALRAIVWNLRSDPSDPFLTTLLEAAVAERRGPSVRPPA